MATTRKNTTRKTKPATRRTRVTQPRRRVAVLAQLDAGDLLQVNRLAGLMELKKVEMAALDGHFNQMVKEIKFKYDVEGNITIDFQTGKITEAVDRSE